MEYFIKETKLEMHKSSMIYTSNFLYIEPKINQLNFERKQKIQPEHCLK